MFRPADLPQETADEAETGTLRAADFLDLEKLAEPLVTVAQMASSWRELAAVSDEYLKRRQSQSDETANTFGM